MICIWCRLTSWVGSSLRDLPVHPFLQILPGLTRCKYLAWYPDVCTLQPIYSSMLFCNSQGGGLLLQFVLPCLVKDWNSFSHFYIALLKFTKLKLYSLTFCPNHMSREIEMLITRQVKLHFWTFIKVSRSFCSEAMIWHFIRFCICLICHSWH